MSDPIDTTPVAPRDAIPLEVRPGRTLWIGNSEYLIIEAEINDNEPVSPTDVFSLPSLTLTLYEVRPRG